MNSPDHHLDPEAIIALGRGELGEARRRLLAPHLADCDECLEQVAAVALLIAARSEQAAAETADGHISADHLRGLALGTLGPVTSEHARRHVGECEHCADALDAVMVMRRRQSRRRWARTALAVASVAAVVTLVVVSGRPAASSTQAGGASVAAAERETRAAAEPGTATVGQAPAARADVEVLLAASAPGRLDAVEAADILNLATHLGDIIGPYAPAANEEAARHARLVLGLEAVAEGRLDDARDALEIFRSRSHVFGAPLLGIVEYARGSSIPYSEAMLRLGVEVGGDPSNNQLVSISLWLLGKMAMERGDESLAEQYWARLAGDLEAPGQRAREALLARRGSDR